MTPVKFNVIVSPARLRRNTSSATIGIYAKCILNNLQTDYLIDFRPADEYIKGLTIDVQ